MLNEPQNELPIYGSKKLYGNRFYLKDYDSIGEAPTKVNDVEDVSAAADGQVFTIKKFTSEIEFKKETTLLDTFRKDLEAEEKKLLKDCSSSPNKLRELSSELRSCMGFPLIHARGESVENVWTFQKDLTDYSRDDR